MKNIDWIFYRENTEGEYVLGSSGIETFDKLAFDFKVTTNAGTERIEKRNLTVVRIPNNEVNGNFEGVCQYIDIAVKESPSQLRCKATQLSLPMASEVIFDSEV